MKEIEQKIYCFLANKRPQAADQIGVGVNRSQGCISVGIRNLCRCGYVDKDKAKFNGVTRNVYTRARNKICVNACQDELLVLFHKIMGQNERFTRKT